MSSQYVFEAAVKGFGTYKYSGTPDNKTLAELLAAAVAPLAEIPADCDGFDLYIVSSGSQLYFENDGTAADANALPIDVGPGPRFRRSRTAMVDGKFKFFSAGAQDIRITLWGTVSV